MKVREEDLRRELEIALAGKDSQSRCAKRLGMRLEKFEKLLRRARIHGASAVLHSNMRRVYDDSFKLRVVNSVLSESLTIGTAGARYNLNECTINTWLRKYREGDETLLLEDGRGRCGMGRKKKPGLEDYEPGSKEYLKLQVELLEREKALLKKALPLIQEKIRSRSSAKSDTSSLEN